MAPVWVHAFEEVSVLASVVHSKSLDAYVKRLRMLSTSVGEGVR
jgi:hypothetical protein